MQIKSAFVGAVLLLVGMIIAEQSYMLNGLAAEPDEPDAQVYAEYVLETLGLR